MEYVGGGSALDLLKPGPMEEEYIGIILRDILKGLEYLHAERKLHRDIKGLFTEIFAKLFFFFQ
jgi:serine/threonine-protein kinase 24/25/MST4